MNYYVTYESKKIFVTNGGKTVLKGERTFNWYGKLFYKFYINDIFILKCSYYAAIFSTSVKIEHRNINELIEFENIGGNYIMNYKNNHYKVIRNLSWNILNFFKNPVYKLSKNDIETGLVYSLDKIAIGGTSKYRVDFYEEDESNLYQIIFFIIKNQKGLFS